MLKKLLARLIQKLIASRKNTEGAEMTAISGWVVFVYKANAVISPAYARKLGSELIAFAEIAERGFSAEGT